VRIETAGENSLILYLAESRYPAKELEQQAGLSAEEILSRVQRITAMLAVEVGPALIDLVPSYASVLIVFDPLVITHKKVSDITRRCCEQLSDKNADMPSCSVPFSGKRVELPVYYSEESGPDLVRLATATGLTVEQVIELHHQQEYRAYAIGFAPGFAYLGQVNERIALPRLETPRPFVPAGAVAIADRQTAVYPAVSPGGWNLIGLCPTPMFDPATDPIMPATVGDTVVFRPITREAFLNLGGNLDGIQRVEPQR
jgi:KipI family sensor histidine kinase inhibitor